MKVRESITMADHHKAMELADMADKARRKGITFHGADTAKILFREAFTFERKAAMRFVNKDLEPTRSVLFRSAAWLAVHAGLLREAEIMAAHGLAGNPPDEIAEELREVMYNIWNEMESKKHEQKETQRV